MDAMALRDEQRHTAFVRVCGGSVPGPLRGAGGGFRGRLSRVVLIPRRWDQARR